MSYSCPKGPNLGNTGPVRGTNSSPRYRAAAALVLLAFLGGALALVLAARSGSTAAWWPAAGIGVITLLYAPRSWWPTLLTALGVAYAAANVVAGRDLITAGLLGGFDTLETGIVSVLLVHYMRRHLEQVSDLWRLLGLAVVGAVPAATGIALTLHTRLGTEFWSVLLRTVPSHVASVVLLTPLVMARPQRLRASRVEVAAQLCALLASVMAIFGPGHRLPLGFAPLPFLVWAAVRFTERIIAVEQTIFAVVVTGCTWAGWGPFALSAESSGAGQQASQLYLLCVVLTGSSLALAVRQRDAALSRVLSSERVFRRGFTGSQVPIVQLRWDGARLDFAELNDAARSLLCPAGEQLTGTAVDSVIASSDLQQAVQEIAGGTRGGWAGRVGITGQPRMQVDATLSPVQELPDGWDLSLHLVDVTESAEMHDRLEAERNYTRAVIDTAGCLIVLTDESGTVIAANPATTRHTGFTEEELLGRPMWELLAPHQRDGAAARFATQQLPEDGEAQLLTKDGGHRAVMFTSEVHRAGPDDPVTVVLSAIDVTDARQNAGLVNHLLRSARTIAFVGTDLEGRISLFNTGAEHILGVDAEHATGRELVDFLDTADLGRFATGPGQCRFHAIVEQAATDLAPETRDWTWVPDGRPPVQVSMTINPVTDTFGDLIGYLFVATDVTDSRRSQEILVRALRREREAVAGLKELDRVKDDFVSTVSHELRTPMSSIIGSAEMLADGMVGDLAPAQVAMVEVISRNGDRLLSLADDLLLLTTFEHDAPAEQSGEVDLRTVVRESASVVGPLLANRRLEVGYTLPEHPVTVAGDADHLERALTNLLTNAVKFTQDGGRVQVETRTDPNTGSAVLSVTDTGLGIPEQDQEQVFARFFRSQLVQERAIQGSGLGLAIVKSIVEAHQGQVTLDSEPGRGSTFTVRLPLAPARAAARPRSAAVHR